MNTAKIEKIIMTHIAEWEHFNLKEWARPNHMFTPMTDIWYRASILPSVNKMVGMADVPHIREFGICVIQVFSRTNIGTADIREKTDSLLKHLTFYRKDDLELLVASSKDIGIRDGFYQININCNYRYK